MINCIAIDDEKKALDVIAHYANQIEYLNLCTTFTNPINAIQYLEQNQVDILFLDINMPGLNGFEFLNTINNKPQVIFTTAYSKYAVESYEVNALDYLVKPITLSRFLKAINKFKKVKQNIIQAPAQNDNDIIFIKSGTGTHRVNKSDILYIKAEGNYSKFVFQQHSILSLISLKKVIEFLNDDNYIQIHRSYIISMSKIQKIESHQMTINNEKLPIGVSYRKSVKNKLLE